MAGISINRSLCLAGLIACLAVEAAQARSKLHHERKASQIEDVFRKLPSIENEVNSLFDDASYFSSFGPSPQADNKSNQEVEDLFRRILQSKEKAKARNLSFLRDHLEEAGVSSFGGDAASSRAGVRGVVPGITEEEEGIMEDFFEAREEETEETTLTGVVGKIGKSNKGVKSFKGLKTEKNKKLPKKGKRYKDSDETHRVEHKLQKSASKSASKKVGKKEKNFSYDPYDGDDDNYDVSETFDFGDWEWEFMDEEPVVENPVDDVDSLFQDNNVAGIQGWRIEPEPESGIGDIMGRVEGVTEEGQYQFSTFLDKKFESVGASNPIQYDAVRSQSSFDSVPSTTTTTSSQFDAVPSTATTTSSQFDAVPSTATTTITAHKVGHYLFNFPTIQHTMFSGPIHLKALSTTDLSPMDPDIFDVLQSIMTPYLQDTVGSDTLHAYNLEVDYSPGHDDDAGKSDVVTLMEVKVTFKVINDSIEAFRSHDNVLASRWIKDFFSGPGGYNIDKLVESLKINDIPVDDISFINEDFETEDLVKQSSVSQANSQYFGKSQPSMNKNNKSSSGAAMVGVTMSVILVAILFFMHYTGRLPSKAQVGEFSLNARDSIKERSRNARDSIKHHSANARDSIKHHSANARDSIKKKMPSMKLGGKKRQGDDVEVGGRRRRTFSGTFRRFPTGGLQKAKIQKKGAKSEHYLGDDLSGRLPASFQKAALSGGHYDNDEYSFSHFAGDYGPGTPSRQSTIPPMTPVSGRSDNEFSMPSYDSRGTDGDSLLDKVGKRASNLMSPRKNSNPYALKSPIPSRAARRVTPGDISDDGSWSVESYETPKKTPSNHPLYRGWNESGPEMRRPVPTDPPAERKEKLSLPFFS